MKSMRTPPGALIETTALTVTTVGRRPLFRDLDLSIADDRVAIVGRNGVGKSTLLDVLAGRASPSAGEVRRHVPACYVPQRLTNEPLCTPRVRTADRDRFTREASSIGVDLDQFETDPRKLSQGELRKLHLLAAKVSAPALLLLDEPTEDLDRAGIAWLCDWVRRWRGGLVVVSHDRELLACFTHFFVASEGGCRYVPGSFHMLAQSLEDDRVEKQRQYLRQLNQLAQSQAHHTRITRRRRRKKNLGRLHEEARRSTRAQLNGNKSYAESSQGRAAKIRNARITSVRAWVHAARRALAVDLPLDLLMPELPPDDGRPLLEHSNLTVYRRDRVAVLGPNGSGKTTLLRKVLASSDDRFGSIAHGGEDWMLEESLTELLARTSGAASVEEAMRLIVAHRFPLALAERSLSTLSPGERVRAALIGLVHRRPTVEILVLDEPSYSLDFVGADALGRALAAWPGALLVATHDQTLVESISVTTRLELGR